MLENSPASPILACHVIAVVVAVVVAELEKVSGRFVVFPDRNLLNVPARDRSVAVSNIQKLSSQPPESL